MGKITVGELGTRLEKISRGELLRELHIIALDYAAQAETRAKGRASSLLTVRSGRLTGSIAGRVVKRSGYVGVRLSAGGGGDDVRYAAAHEYGATIRPKKAKFLTIPVHDELKTQAGGGRVPSARDIPGLTYAGSAKGQRMLIHELTGEVWYILRQRVKIPARPYLAPSRKDIEKKMRPEVRSVLKGVI